jgi:putative zinc finger/helix-turn-helix YgiT family protein
MREYSFDDEFMRCKSCGHEFLTVEQSIQHSRRRAAAIAAVDNRPSPKTVLATRVALGLTQPQLERALGVGPKTAVRWEKGTVAPSGPVARLLRVAEMYPVVFAKIAEEFGVELPPVQANRSRLQFTATRPNVVANDGQLQRILVEHAGAEFSGAQDPQECVA